MGSQCEGLARYYPIQAILEDEMDLAAWQLAGAKPNGHLEKGIYFWPEKVRSNLTMLEKIIREVRATCSCRRKDGSPCARTEQTAKVALVGLGVKKCHARKISESLAVLVHTKATVDRSKD